MKFSGIVFAVVTGALVSACIPRVNVEDKKAEYASLRPTVASYDDMIFEPLRPLERKDFEIKTGSPVFDFGAEGASYFQAFELPEMNEPYHVVINSYQYAVSCIGCGAAFFLQTVKLLDGSKNVIPVKRPAPVQVLLDNVYRREISFTVLPDDGARYVVVHTSKQFVEGGESHIRDAPGLFIYPVIIPTGTQQASAKGLPTGRLRIQTRR
ncbi:MAG: hypothetical protein KF895_08695 [Parvibaculum sp.]|nr:hypothetical protein [Parvibaculum sp.]